MTIGSFLEKKKINNYIDKYQMLQKGDGVVIGLSGGPDSVCLFLCLMQLRQDLDLDVQAVHINHCIRGKDADEDQQFVENLCTQNDVKCHSFRIDIPALVEKSGRSVEEEARLARYDKFEAIAAEAEEETGRPYRIAIAHNANDNVETVLFHMIRGCGLDGMCGIQPVRDRIIRPLLQVSKAEIMDFLHEMDFPYCIDGTNAEVDYDRNRIRHNILPELEQINSQALQHIVALTERLQGVSDFLDIEANGLLAMATLPENKLRKRTLATAPRAVCVQAIKQYLSQFMPEQKDVSESHINQVIALLAEEGEKYVDLPHGKRLVIGYEELMVVDQSNGKCDLLDWAEKMQGRFKFAEIPMYDGAQYPLNTYTKWFDCDKITNDIVIRTRTMGDYLTINSDGGTKSIQDYFVDAKIPKHLRDSIPLVCDGNHVLWVVGYRISEYYKVDSNTTRILEISYLEE